MSFSRVGPNQTIERGQFRVAKSLVRKGEQRSTTARFEWTFKCFARACDWQRHTRIKLPVIATVSPEGLHA